MTKFRATVTMKKPWNAESEDTLQKPTKDDVLERFAIDILEKRNDDDFDVEIKEA